MSAEERTKYIFLTEMVDTAGKIPGLVGGIQLELAQIDRLFGVDLSQDCLIASNVGAIGSYFEPHCVSAFASEFASCIPVQICRPQCYSIVIVLAINRDTLTGSSDKCVGERD